MKRETFYKIRAWFFRIVIFMIVVQILMAIGKWIYSSFFF